MAGIEHDIDALEAKIRTAIEGVKNLDNGLLEGVLEVIRLPGWTSSAEFVFTMGLTEALIDQLAVVSRMQGTLIAGETSADAALREVREETGWRCELVRELEAVTYWFQRDGRRIRKTVHWYLMRPIEKEGDHDHEVDEVRWAAPEEADSLLRYDSDRRLLSLVRSA